MAWGFLIGWDVPPPSIGLNAPKRQTVVFPQFGERRRYVVDPSRLSTESLWLCCWRREICLNGSADLGACGAPVAK